MRLIDADELIEHVWRDKLDSRELIAEMINNAPTVKEIPTKIPISIFEELISKCVEHDLKAYSDGANEILDKIRSEINQAYCDITNDYDRGRNYGLYMAAEIIDKYRKE